MKSLLFVQVRLVMLSIWFYTRCCYSHVVCMFSLLSLDIPYWQLACFMVRFTQGRSQPHSPGQAKGPLTSFYPQISIYFSHFSSNFTYFLPHFGSPGGRVATTLLLLNVLNWCTVWNLKVVAYIIFFFNKKLPDIGPNFDQIFDQNYPIFFLQIFSNLKFEKILKKRL